MSIREFNEDNPFIEKLQDIKTGTRTAICSRGNIVSMVDDDTGEVKGRGFNAVIREKQYDSERFVKMYAAGRKVLPNLSVAATRILWYIVDHMGYDDMITLNITKIKKETGYKSNAAIYRAISELKNHCVLANAYQNGIYYINPAMFYRGNRLKLLI
ncbi:replication protein RepL [Dysgonomonas alginatilytica]|uniref:Replication protein RepL n=1 Tax=Dysgonomonas alginatilytica TaxID=1605892 RepID=A0A2V3PR93_9BACT|nr:replication/maintenance protein RepL [Dysgonomonas alginatilytica]PXV66850.1 replication protein RepL [Dysgonomonas alginatilytica]